MATSKSPERKVRVLKPQFGPQEKFLATPADICIYGGAAGGGKTYGLLLSALRYKNVKGFGCTIFRKNYKQIFAQGGLWDEAQKMYHGINGAKSPTARGRFEIRTATRFPRCPSRTSSVRKSWTTGRALRSARSASTS